MTYKLIELEQGSQEWLDFRKGKIGASDAAAIMGESPWKTPLQLWKQMTEGTSDSVNPAMQKGTRLEPIARALFISQTGIHVRPVVAQSNIHSWQIASLDGMSEDGSVVLEIKCGGKELHEGVRNGIIPSYYEMQLQHQANVVLPKRHIFASYFEGELLTTDYEFNYKLAERLNEVEEKFFWMLQTREAPPASDGDYVQFKNESASEILRQILSICAEEKMLKETKEALKGKLFGISPQANFILDGVKVYQTQNATYDTKAMKAAGIDIDKFKKVSSPYWVISSRGKA